MQVFTIPTSQQSLENLRQHCTALELPSPKCWRFTHFHRTLRDLVTSGDTFAPPARYSPTLDLAGLHDQVILFCNIHPDVIRNMVMAYKRQGQWPIFAAITKQSLDMPMYVLIEHLKDDRQRENLKRDLKQKATR